MPDVVTFTIDDRRLALRSAAVQEVLRAVAITPLPGAPTAIEGIIDVRGAIVPVYDLRRRLGLPAREVHPDDHMVVSRAGPRGLAALRVTRVLELQGIDEAEVPDPADRIVAGLARMTDGLYLICELDAFLTDAEASDVAIAIARSP